MSRRGQPDLLNAQAVSTIRRLVGLNDEGAITDQAAMERLDAFWDELAGPHGLTWAEKSAMRACRERFGHYDPNNLQQICFLEARKTVVASPRDAYWQRYLNRWKAA